MDSLDSTIAFVRVVSEGATPGERETLRACLSRSLPEIPPRYFYDDVGSALFERITGLEVYYQTRTEILILERYAKEILASSDPTQVVELGSGAGRKIRLLLEAWGSAAAGGTCGMLDINELFLRQSLERLGADHPTIQFRGIVGDFVEDVDRIGAPGRRLVVFFGGTIGNLYPHERRAFLRKLAAGMDHTDTMLVGVDLVKHPARLEAAYDDPDGVTAAFNRNMLTVLNRRFDADFDPSGFEHRALYDAENAWIEMRLVAGRACRVNVRSIGMYLDFAQGEELRTEISCKFTRASLASSAAEVGLVIDGWFTDPEALFALALLRKQAS